MEIMSWNIYTVIFFIIGVLTLSLNSLNILDSDKEYRINEGFDLIQDYYLKINFKNVPLMGKIIISLNIILYTILIFNVWMYQSLIFLILILIEFRLRMTMKSYNKSKNKDYILIPLDVKILFYYILLLFSIYVSNFIYLTYGKNYSFINYMVGV